MKYHQGCLSSDFSLLSKFYCLPPLSSKVIPPHVLLVSYAILVRWKQSLGKTETFKTCVFFTYLAANCHNSAVKDRLMMTSYSINVQLPSSSRQKQPQYNWPSCCAICCRTSWIFPHMLSSAINRENFLQGVTQTEKYLVIILRGQCFKTLNV